MRLDANNSFSLYALDNALRNAQEPTLDLFSKIINSAFTRVQALGQALTHIVRLAEIGAWTEATFALIALELPLWTVRRLIYENGEWLCSLSRQPNLPMTFDDCPEASHEVLPLAMLRTFVEARELQVTLEFCGKKLQSPSLQESPACLPADFLRRRLLCRVYENGAPPISNSYAAGSRFHSA